MLVTHGPPFGILDPGIDLGPDGRLTRVHAGDQDLLDAVRRIHPRYHVFGHLHEGYGVLEDGRTTFVNAANVDDDYRLAHQPVVLDI